MPGVTCGAKMQSWQYGKILIYLRPIFRLTKLAFLTARVRLKGSTGLNFSNFRSRFSIPSQCSSGPVGRLILLAETLAWNKSALCRIASLAFRIVVRKFGAIHSRNVGSTLVWDDIAHSCYDQVSKQGIHWPVAHDLIAGSSFGALRLRT